MRWKSWPYWLRGGVIASAIAFLLLFIGMIYSIFLDIHSPGVIEGYSILDYVFDSMSTIILWIPFLILAFVVGTLLGLVVEYITKKNKKK